ncbi:hypothetical protein DFQ26_001730, partial [Actinomortierella ambigua]
LKRFLKEDESRFERLEWAVPVFQLFHVQMVLSNTILKIHWGAISAPGSLSYLVNRLDRKRVYCNDKSDFHTANQFLRRVFVAILEHLWDTEGARSDDDDRPEWQFAAAHDFAKSIHDRIFSDKETLEMLPLGDRNALLFLRDMLVYVELDASIKTGDIGRIANVLQTITIMLQDAGRRRYSLELLRFTYLIRQAWSDDWRRTILSSMLINMYHDGFQAKDLLHAGTMKLVDSRGLNTFLKIFDKDYGQYSNGSSYTGDEEVMTDDEDISDTDGSDIDYGDFQESDEEDEFYI